MYSVTPQHCLPDVAECGAGLLLPLHSTDSKLEGIDSVWDHVVDVHENQLFYALHDNWYECHWPEVV